MADSAAPGTEPSRSLPLRGRITGRGYVERITIFPRNVPPRFAAMVALHEDESGEGFRPAQTARLVRLEWTGQRKIPGIDPGIRLAFEGMVSNVDGIPTIHNPRYEIIGRSEELP